ncbi:MAG: hypothetical protein AAF560_20605 [Acidobacteriota bacterium]
MSASMELDFEHPDFSPISVTDCLDNEHDFEFRTHLHGEVVKIDALEVREGEVKGYEFSVLGDAERDPMELFQALYQRMRDELGKKYLSDTERPQIAETNVRGRIEWDEETDGALPRLVIDGREISWYEMGRMLMSYEGWRFDLEIQDCDATVGVVQAGSEDA